MVDLPKDSKAIGCRWVFRKDWEQYSEVSCQEMCSGRYCDNEVFSSVVKHMSIRMLLTMVAQFELELEQLDVKTMFLYCELEEIYKKQPEGYIQEGQEN